MTNPEHGPASGESKEKLSTRDLERAPEILDKKVEKSNESKEEAERSIETARHEADREAVSGREVSRGEHKQKANEQSGPAFHSRQASYKHTMKRVQSEMTAPERAFSKVIHNKVVERVSDAVGSTVARPDAILSGSIFAFLSVLALYLTAKYYGFSLQGSETIIAFILGWAAGIVFDLLRALFKRR